MVLVVRRPRVRRSACVGLASSPGPLDLVRVYTRRPRDASRDSESDLRGVVQGAGPPGERFYFDPP